MKTCENNQQIALHGVVLHGAVYLLLVRYIYRSLRPEVDKEYENVLIIYLLLVVNKETMSVKKSFDLDQLMIF